MKKQKFIKTKYAGVHRVNETNSFRVRIKTTDPRTGKVRDVRRHVEAKTAAEAEAQRQELQREHDGSKRPETLFSEYAASWLQRKAHELRHATLERYASTITAHLIPQLGMLTLQKMVSNDIWACRDRWAKEYKPQTVNGHLRILKTILADAADELQIHNPAGRVRCVSEGRSERRALTIDEFRLVLEKIGELPIDQRSFCLAAAYTGMRFGELSALHLADDTRQTICVRRSQVRGHAAEITKTGVVLVLPVVPELRAVLDEYRAWLMRTRTVASPLMWCTDEGGYRSRTWVSKPLARIGRELGLTKTLSGHVFRHTWFDLVRRVASDQVRRELTGHSTAHMEDRYSRVDVDEKMATAGAALRLVKGGA